MFNQKTIKKSISLKGVGLHTGVETNLTIKPSRPNTGIQFIRTDIKKNNIIFPSVYNVTNTTLCTTIENAYKIKVSTIEHLMGALLGLGIDNAIIEIDNVEVPILDGSAKVFVKEINKVGIDESETPIKVIKVNKKVYLNDNSKSISIEPSKTNMKIDFELKYQNPLINTQKNIIDIYNSDLNDIFNSRTFCLYEDIDKLKSIGLAKGGSLSNAIVVKDKLVLNEEGLRNEKEFVNHKILDCMGDLFLSGYRMIGNLKCSQGGHKLTNDLLRILFNDTANYSVVEIKEKMLSTKINNQNTLREIA